PAFTQPSADHVPCRPSPPPWGDPRSPLPHPAVIHQLPPSTQVADPPPQRPPLLLRPRAAPADTPQRLLQPPQQRTHMTLGQQLDQPLHPTRQLRGPLPMEQPARLPELLLRVAD